MTEPRTGPAAEARRIYAEFLEQREAGDEVDLEGLCARHPALAEELRGLHRGSQAIDGVLGDLRGNPASLQERLRARFGADLLRSSPFEPEPGVSAVFSNEVLERLASRRNGLGRHRLERELAHGGQGLILEVWDEDLRRHLAMKVLLQDKGRGGAAPSHQANALKLGRFLEEAQITGQLDHPGVVPIHELGLDEEGHVYYTMKLLKGRTLREIVRLVDEGREGWTLTRGLSVVLKVCDAMAYAHHKRVVHRDLKPGNVMVGRYGEVYVIDWGLARVMGREDTRDIRIRPPELEHATVEIATDRHGTHSDVSGSALVTMDGDVLGTPSYMSPEQAHGDVERVGPRSDVYSVGAMLYHLLTGHAPYYPKGSRLSGHDVLALLRQGPPPPVEERAPRVPAELAAICEKAMAREPRERYAGMEELAADLSAYLESRVVRAHRTGPVAELRKWVARNRGFAAAAGLVVALLFGLVASAGLFARARAGQIALAGELRRETGVADRTLLAGLSSEARTLWPALPPTIPAYESWIERAEDLLARREQHRETLALAEEVSAAARAAGRAEGHEPRFKREALVRLLAELDELAHPDSGRLAEVRRRLELARRVEERTLTGAAASAAWREARRAIADHDESPLYRGLEIEPVLGLLPLGPDADSGLQEFAHVLSGEVPERGADGSLRIGPESCIVLVLIPDGGFRMGAQARDPALPGYDPLAQPDESPVHDVVLDAYFLAKHELTQAQWERASGEQPSFSRAADWEVVDPTHPVESVSYERCVELLAQLDLTLPTEAQWEYAARGGTETPWWTGSDVRSIAGAASIADKFAKESRATWSQFAEWVDDGYTTHGPVNALRANPFGLHMIMGNVDEWCLDPYLGYEVEPRPGDGLRVTTDQRARSRIIRGGAFHDVWPRVRSSSRRQSAFPSSAIGVRPARALGDREAVK